MSDVHVAAYVGFPRVCRSSSSKDEDPRSHRVASATLKMRICYVAHSNSHFTAPYVDYFSAHGHEIHVVSFHPQDLARAVMHHPAGRRFNPEKHKLRYLWDARSFISLVRRINPDILHAHYVTSNGVLAAASGVHPLV